MNHFADTSVTDLFARDGHLTMLSLDRFEQGELSVAACEAVLEHLRGCRLCELRHDALEDESLILSPPPHLQPLVPLPLHRLMLTAATLAAAAVLLVVALPRPEAAYRQPNESLYNAGSYTTTSDGMDAGDELEVFEADANRRVFSHDAVPWAVPLRLQVAMTSPRYIAVLRGSFDAHGSETSPLQLLLPTTSEPLRTWTTTLDVAAPRGEAVEERFILVSCAEPFALEPTPESVDWVASDEGCTAREVTVQRAAR